MALYYKPAIISDQGGDLTKTWYITYYVYNPVTEKNQRFRETGDANRFSTKKGRREALKVLMMARNQMLADGWTPFTEYTPSILMVEKHGLHTTLKDALSEAMIKKKGELSERSYRGLSYRVADFLEWLAKHKLLLAAPSDLKRRHVNQYLTAKLESGISNRTRNNYLADIRSVLTELIELEYIDHNPAMHIKKLENRSEMHKSYTLSEVEMIKNYLLEHEPSLYTFCSLLIYQFLRPIELTRLRIAHINLQKRSIQVPSSDQKTGLPREIRIQDPVLPLLQNMHLDQYPKNYFVFTSKRQPSAKQTDRDFFTKRFAKHKKAMGLEPMHTLYSLKHTMIEHLRHEMGLSDLEITAITGHSTEQAMKLYDRRKKQTEQFDWTQSIGLKF